MGAQSLARTLLVAAFALAVSFGSTFVDAKGSGHGSGGHSSDYSSRSSGSHISSPRSALSKGSKATPGSSHAKGPSSSGAKVVPSVRRDTHGQIARSSQAKNDFKKSRPCPSTGKASGACPGYVIDHVKPLKRGGADSPSNMQWQTKEAAKEKDRTE